MSDEEATTTNRLSKTQWSRDQEELLAEWSDKAAGYRWMHDRTSKKFAHLNACITIPVIILSTLSGTANFGLTSIFPPSMADIATLCIGGVSLITGIISTIGNFLRYAQGMEAHHIASISWGKLQRKIAVELALAPHLRADSMDFLKLGRAEMDRLIEQSPIIPDDIIAWYIRVFKNVKDLKKPEICDSIEHTHIYKIQEEHVAEITARAASLFTSKNNDELFPPEMRREVAKEVSKRTPLKANVKAGILKYAKTESKKDIHEFNVTNPLRNDVTVPTLPSENAQDDVSIRVQPVSGGEAEATQASNEPAGPSRRDGESEA